ETRQAQTGRAEPVHRPRELHARSGRSGGDVQRGAGRAEGGPPLGWRRPIRRQPGVFYFPAARTIGAHLSISLRTSRVSASGVRPAASGMSLPISSRRRRTVASSSAATIAALSLARIGFGVFFGANIAFQADA